MTAIVAARPQTPAAGAGATSGASSRSGSASSALYQVARGVADRNPTRAFENGLGVISIEERVGDLFELTLAEPDRSSHFLDARSSRGRTGTPSSRSSGSTLLWVYLRRNEHVPPLPELDPARERDRPGRLRRRADRAAADVPDVRLPGHARRVRRAEPRQRPDPARVEPVRGDAEPARGRRADRRASRWRSSVRRWWAKALWLLWPAWVWFAVMATGNHFWLDILAGHRRRAPRGAPSSTAGRSLAAPPAAPRPRHAA